MGRAFGAFRSKGDSVPLGDIVSRDFTGTELTFVSRRSVKSIYLKLGRF
jgi:hypothetical protein